MYVCMCRCAVWMFVRVGVGECVCSVIRGAWFQTLKDVSLCAIIKSLMSKRKL